MYSTYNGLSADDWKSCNVKKHTMLFRHRQSLSILTCRFRRYLESFLDGSNSTVEIRVTRREYTSKHTVQKHISLFISESLQGRAPYTPDPAGGFVGDG